MRVRAGATCSSTAPHRPVLRRVGTGCHDVPMAGGPRFLTLGDVAEILNTSSAQVYALVRRGDLPAIKVGGRGQWRVETAKLEEYIARQYDETRRFIEEHPFEAEVDADI